MYERNINVIEMFIEKKLGYVETYNIRNNYYDYKDLVKVLDDYINICGEQEKSKTEYENSVANIKNIQATTEKLYNQNVKFEYSRNILFADVNRKVEDIEKCLTKIELALDKNKDTFKTLRKDFIQGIIDLNEKHRKFKQISRPKNKIETDYKDALALIKDNYNSINPQDIDLARKFVENVSLFEDELVEKLMKNGKNEKVPFDENSMIAAAKLGLDIAQKEVENYLFMYDQTTKIFKEIEENKLKLEARKKHIVDVGAKLEFLAVEKEYLVQFLDNERVTAIQGQTEHDRIMKNCCKCLKDDTAQINVLYDLIIKETKKRATNRIYEELYNKKYLEKIQDKEKDFMDKTNNMNCANGTLISPNYWRIGSIKAIYDSFDKIVYEVYGRKFVLTGVDDEVQAQSQAGQVAQVSEVSNSVEENKVDNFEVGNPQEESGAIVEDVQPTVQEIQETIVESQEDEKDTAVSTVEKATVNQKTRRPKFRIIKRNIKIEDEDAGIELDEELEVESPKVKKVTRAKKIDKPKAITNPVQASKQENVKAIKKVKPEKEISIFEAEKNGSEEDELADIEAIIKEAQESLEPKGKKSNIIKKMVKPGKGKLAEQ